MGLKLEKISVAENLFKATIALGEEGQKIEDDNLIDKKARALADYDKALALETIKLLGEQKPTTVIPTLAKGNCSEMLYAREVAVETLKAHYSKIDRIQSQQNALQSLLKQFDNVDSHGA